MAGFGATTGLVVDSGKNMAVVARGWARSGSWVNKKKTNGKTAYWGIPQVPTTLEAGVGYDISRRGLRLELAFPAFGFVRAPMDGNGQVVSAQIGARIAGTFLDNSDDKYFVAGGYISFSFSPILSHQRGSSRRSDWEAGSTFWTVGPRIEAFLGGGSEWGSLFIGPEFEKLEFYHIYLNEGPRAEPIRESPSQ